MLKLWPDLNFPWEQQQYIKTYKRLFALGQLSPKTHTLLSLARHSDNWHNGRNLYHRY